MAIVLVMLNSSLILMVIVVANIIVMVIVILIVRVRAIVMRSIRTYSVDDGENTKTSELLARRMLMMT